jgi:hypothetical protein
MKKIMLSLCLILSACAANPYKVETLKNVEIEKKGSLTDSSSIGINSNNEAVVQSVDSVETELNSLVWWNNNKSMELNSEYAQLKSCRKDLSDPRLGGAERVKLPDLKKKWNEKVTERTGLVDEKLVVVKEQYLKEKIATEKEKSEYYDEVLVMVKESKEECETIMGNSRVKAGLPSTRYQGQITVTPDGKVGSVVERHESNLDDAFDIQKDKDSAKVDMKEERGFQRDLELQKAKNPVPPTTNNPWGY